MPPLGVINKYKFNNRIGMSNSEGNGLHYLRQSVKQNIPIG